MEYNTANSPETGKNGKKLSSVSIAINLDKEQEVDDSGKSVCFIVSAHI